ncbi:UNVERIFIED_CONTAM: Argininosuccinate lyase, chloroplastic [Sesamum radiatum]|uniref:Argininosuccinate lyase, chloroplastic n=1 Tax=Sesamum radiatum TaxID=300843 RepID=A0AAW2TXS6_SESRA
MGSVMSYLGNLLTFMSNCLSTILFAVILWLLTAASIKTGRPQIAKRKMELVEQHPAKDGWHEYYDGITGRGQKHCKAKVDAFCLMEFLSANSITAIHLSRLGEEWVLLASEEFGFLVPSDSVSARSSIMPQKKNPDPMELVRGKSARVVGDLVSLLVSCKHHLLMSHAGCQEDKEPVFDSVKTIMGTPEVSAEFADNITFNQERIRNALPAGHLDATSLADYLVKKILLRPFIIAFCCHRS